jgi:hypothetical protein
MLSLSPATRIFLALSPIDGRKSFNGLCGSDADVTELVTYGSQIDPRLKERDRA